ncbi:MAG TPA: hypothetical protein VGC62_16135 [Pseudomonas sp.]|uniref:hypothetical protein n=1 Tax=Pseudomonas sp. TaxID=306 RepID=UPI002ED7F211
MSLPTGLRSITLCLALLLPGCAALQPPRPAFPDTPERSALMDRIVEKSMMVKLSKNNEAKPKPSTPQLSTQQLIEARKKDMGFSMPEDYWLLYAQNLETFKEDVSQNDAKTLTLYKLLYRATLTKATDQELVTLANTNANDMESTPTFKSVVKNPAQLTMAYFQTGNLVTGAAIGRHLKRMREMDTIYNVCPRYKNCWGQIPVTAAK